MCRQPQQAGEERAHIVATQDCIGQKALAFGRGVEHPILAPKAPRIPLVPGEVGDVAGDLDAIILIEAARVAPTQPAPIRGGALGRRRGDCRDPLIRVGHRTARCFHSAVPPRRPPPSNYPATLAGCVRITYVSYCTQQLNRLSILAPTRNFANLW